MTKGERPASMEDTAENAWEFITNPDTEFRGKTS